MDIVTVLGITWHKASMGDLLVAFIIIMIPVSIFLLYKILQKIRNKKIHEEQVFLFRLKRLGLSNFQIRIVNNLITMIGSTSPLEFLGNPAFFEKAVGTFLSHTRGTGETEDSQRMICRDLTVIYDKLFFHMNYKKPLKGIEDIDAEQLIYFSPLPEKVFLGKIISRDARTLTILIFGNTGDLAAIPVKHEVTFHVYRVGDAEYEFVSAVQGHQGATLKVDIPHEIVMREEVRHPYVDVIIPAILFREQKASPQQQRVVAEGEKADDDETAGLPPDEAMVVDGAEEKLSCTMYKLNDYESVVRVSKKLDYRYRYYLDFQVMDFNVRALVRIIATKTVEEADALYYTVKFDDLSSSSRSVLKKYVYEHL